MDETIRAKINKIDGWLFDEEADLLAKYAEDCDMFSSILELGSFKGKSTVAIAAHTDAIVYAVDTFMADATTVQRQNTFKEFLENVADYPNVWPVPTTTENARLLQVNEWIPSNYKLLFIDADHSYEGVKWDFARFAPLVELGGHVIFHDAYGENGEEGPTTPWPGVTQFVRELYTVPEWKFVEKVRRCAVFKRV